MEDLYEFETDENALDIFLSEEDEQLDEKSSKRAKRKRRAKKKKKKAKRDACYYKVKSSYDVWPSAYASGALTKCRKVGAKNWGNKSKKNESVEEELAKIIEQELRNDFQHIFQEELAAVIEEKKKKRKKKKKKKKKAGSESSKESNLGDWFGRKGAPGKKGGWVDCNTCRKGKCKPCGRKKGEKRAKYPSCRPTPGACKEKGRGRTWGKKSAKGKK